MRVEAESFNELKLPWAITKSDSWFTDVRIHAGINEEEIGLVMLEACWMNIIDDDGKIIKETASEILKEFVADEGFVLSGGLVFKEKGEVKVSPGCCGGLEDWSDWFDVARGETNIWTGHSPESLVEVDGGIIKIWNDANSKDEAPSIELSIEELIENMKIVEKDLNDFLIRLANWTKSIEPALEQEVVSYFAKNMNIDVWADELIES